MSAALVQLAAVAELDDDQDRLAAVIEAALERSGRRGLTPAAAARLAHCTTEQARPVLAWLVAHQYAHTRGPHYHAGPTRRHR